MKANFSHVTEEISRIVKGLESLLIDLSEDTVTLKRNHNDWTIKQTLGHLIDSASNNHQRMVRLQYNENLVFPDYGQDNDLWVTLQDYQHADWKQLIQFWKFYNLHLVQVIKSIDEASLENFWHSFDGTKVSLKDMIEGYLKHLQLHMDEICELAKN